ncbi:NAD(P)-dependent alcohol dehydrogenase [Polaribacter vadi]|uniref:NAD(P)-dependent alcohol dehydrogenase n=1 Tax=Polaribacter TaxID=52959 RepID=UPI001C08D1F9|nr:MULTISPECIES: NAD(P)-dependent alcohol dehydrogenase [Polaribacter]MBU3010125.1 NAD(P)-dependent alcohol dehydrogenase [Polaribacter vadi]MDO6739932.1 NAD(P)-dependent alcohol dehydrogenase [Polaribacter sp. 1_MG-2023]
MIRAVYKKYGGPEVLEFTSQEKPIPKANEILVKILASSATRADTLIREGSPKFGRLFLGVFKPKNTSLGTGFSGEVEEKGSDVTKFKIKDEVFGELLFDSGTNAEYLCISEDLIIAKKPKNISHSEAAPICDGFLTSYSFLKDIANVKEGQHILINGASGSLGTAAVQLAKQMGAKVTAVCSGKNKELVKNLGADSVIDYKKQDFTKEDNLYDIIYDTIGKSSYKKCKKVLKKNGIFMSPVLNCETLWFSIFKPKKVKFSATGIRKTKDLKRLLSELIPFFKQGKMETVIDKTYKLKDIVAAHSYINSERKVGNIAILNS